MDKNEEFYEPSSVGKEHTISYGSDGFLIYKEDQLKKKIHAVNNRKAVEGNKIYVCVELNNGKIKWMIGSEEIGEVSLEFLKDEKRQFVPFFEMK